MSTAPALKRYVDLDIEIYEYEQDGDVERVRVRATEWQKPDQAERVELPSGLRQRVAQLERRDLDFEGLIRLGEELAAVLLPLGARECFYRSVDRLAANEGLRLRIRLGAWALADLPWEYAYVLPRSTPLDQKDVTGFLALDRRLSVVRHEILDDPLPRLEPLGNERLRLVALMAAPPGTAGLDLDGEAESIRRALEDLPAVEAEIHSGATRADLQAALDRSAHVFHFAGHGRFDTEMGESYGTVEGRGSLLLEGEDGEPESVSAEELALNLKGSGVRLAVLAACEGGRRDGVRAWSGIAPALARAGLPAVVAMQYRVRDDKAVDFSRRFYQSLVTGGAVDAAVTAGRLAMFDAADAYGRDWGAPVLYLRSEQAVLFPTTTTEPGPTWTKRFAANLALTAAITVLALLYYANHLAPHLPKGLVFGGASLAVVASVATWLVGKLAGKEVTGWVRSLLRRRRLTAWLAGACAALLLLSLATSSVYLIPDEAEASAPPAKVRISSSDQPRLGQTLEVEKRPVGRMYFGRWRPARLSLELLEPGGFKEEQTTLWPGWSLHHRVPGDFTVKVVRVLRLAPFTHLWRLLRKAGSERPSDVSLRVLVNGEEALVIEDLRRQAVLIGAGADDMVRIENETAVQAVMDELTARPEASSLGADKRSQWVALWRAKPRTVEGLELTDDDEIMIEVMADAVEPFRITVPADPAGKPMRTVFLQRADG